MNRRLDWHQGFIEAPQLEQGLPLDHQHVGAWLRDGSHQLPDNFQCAFVIFLGEMELRLGLEGAEQKGFGQAGRCQHLVVGPDSVWIEFLQVVGVTRDVPELRPLVVSQPFAALEFFYVTQRRGIVLVLDHLLDFGQLFVNLLAHGHGFLGLALFFVLGKRRPRQPCQQEAAEDRADQ